MIRRYNMYLALISLLFILISCGGGSGGSRGGEDAPADATMTVNPSATSIEIAEGATLTTYTSSYTVVIKDANGIPLNDVDITISYPWASTSKYSDVVQFYDGDPNGSGTAIPSPMVGTTDKNGAYTIWFTYWVGDTIPATADSGDLEYSGYFQFTSGSLFNSASFEVKLASAT